MVVEKTAAKLRVYDLSERLPVLRSFQAANVSVAPGSSWRHANAVSLYKDSELEAIVQYLHWAANHM